MMAIHHLIISMIVVVLLPPTKAQSPDAIELAGESSAAVNNFGAQNFRINIDVEQTASQLINLLKLDLGISKGFAGSGRHFNTVWISEPFGRLFGRLVYEWAEVSIASFVGTTGMGDVIRTQITPDSPRFVASQTVAYDVSGWSGPFANNLGTRFQVDYRISTQPLHLVLQTPAVRNGVEMLSTYFYDDTPSSNSSIIGAPIVSLFLYLNRNVRTNTFTGNVLGDGLLVQFDGTTNERNVCITSTNSAVRIVAGRCRPA